MCRVKKFLARQGLIGSCPDRDAISAVLWLVERESALPSRHWRFAVVLLNASSIRPGIAGRISGTGAPEDGGANDHVSGGERRASRTESAWGVIIMRKHTIPADARMIHSPRCRREGAYGESCRVDGTLPIESDLGDRTTWCHGTAPHTGGQGVVVATGCHRAGAHCRMLKETPSETTRTKESTASAAAGGRVASRCHDRDHHRAKTCAASRRFLTSSLSARPRRGSGAGRLAAVVTARPVPRGTEGARRKASCATAPRSRPRLGELIAADKTVPSTKNECRPRNCHSSRRSASMHGR